MSSRALSALASAADRPTLRAFALAIAVTIGASLLVAAGVPSSVTARVLLVTLSWSALATLLAYVFLPTVDLPWRRIARAPAGVTDRTVPTVALTFDDGPHPETTPALLEALARADLHATFFLVGEHVERWPDLARAIVAAGHTIGNHTQRHRLLPLRTSAQIVDEIDACQRAFARHLGRIAVSLFRAPHGFKPVGLHRLLARRGLTSVGWQGSIRDTDAPGVELIVKRALELARPGRILLLHDNPSTRGQTARALGELVARYRALGYRFVTLS